MTEKKAKLSRRNFLLTVGAGGAAHRSRHRRRKTAPTAKQPRTSAPRAATRPREHINNYYRTTKV